MSLDYQTDPALAGCPSPADFRKAIVRQLGHDPFRDNAPRRMLVRLYPTGARMGGRVEWRDANDQWEGERTFSSRNESCAEMARAMALATAIQIDLLAIPDQAPLEKPAVEAKPPAAKLAEAKPAVAPPAPAGRGRNARAPAGSRKSRASPSRSGWGRFRISGTLRLFVLPRIAVSVGRLSVIGVRLALSGLGPGADVTRTDGVAQMNRFVMTLELVRLFRAGRMLQPLLAVGAGWQDVGVKGISADVSRDHEGQAVSGLVHGERRFGLRRSRRGSRSSSRSRRLLFWPSVTVEVGSSQAAHLDGAALFAHGGLLARF